MKKLFVLPAFMLLIVSAVMAQPIPEKNKEGFVTGQVTLPDNTVITGTVKDNIRKKGEVTILKDGKKSKYQAADISSVQIGENYFVTSNNTFYELAWETKTLSLYRKANNSTGIQFNGNEPVAISNSEGEVGDLFIKKSGDGTFYQLTGKNVKEVLGKLCSTCVVTIDPANFDAESVKKTLSACDCK